MPAGVRSGAKILAAAAVPAATAATPAQRNEEKVRNRRSDSDAKNRLCFPPEDGAPPPHIRASGESASDTSSSTTKSTDEQPAPSAHPPTKSGANVWMWLLLALALTAALVPYGPRAWRLKRRVRKLRIHPSTLSRKIARATDPNAYRGSPTAPAREEKKRRGGGSGLARLWRRRRTGTGRRDGVGDAQRRRCSRRPLS